MNLVVHGGLDERELAHLGLDAGDVVDLSANVHPDGPPLEIVEAARAADIGRYPEPDARSLREAIARHHGVDAESVVVTPGAAAAIYLALAALAGPGDRVAIDAPTFGEYARAAAAVGANVQRADFECETPADAALAVLCNPNNPTGRYLARPAVERLLLPRGHLLIDAAYEGLAEEPWSAVDLVRDGLPVTVIHSLTKLFAMPGVRLGYIVTEPHIARRIARRQAPWPVGADAVAAGLAAIDGMERRIATVSALHARRRALEAVFRQRGIRISETRTNFLLAEVGDGAAFRSALLARGFAVRDAASFGLPSHVRLAVPRATDMPALLDALDRVLDQMEGESDA